VESVVSPSSYSQQSDQMDKALIGIESTAHTFGVGVCSLDHEILFNHCSTFITTEGGIHPREAARHHANQAPRLLKKALDFMDSSRLQLVGVSVALGPGLGPCLRIGAVTARAVSLKFGVPLLPINHSVAHIEVARKFSVTGDPVTLFVSGGNTAIVLFSADKYVVMGETLDISVGNLLDVLARDMGFGYPGAPRLLELAQASTNFIELPYSIKGQDVSFSGILTHSRKLLSKGIDKASLAFSVVETSFSMLTEAVERVLAFSGKKEVSLTGGVARSRRLSSMLEEMCRERNTKFSVVPPDLAGDNGAMIAYVGSLYYPYNYKIPVEQSFVRPRWRIEKVYIPWRQSWV
jgi:N6-L-threonylcarbamoyladenine synthase